MENPKYFSINRSVGKVGFDFEFFSSNLRAKTGRDSSRDSGRDSGRELIRDFVLVDPVLVEQDGESAHDPDEGNDEQTGWKQEPF